MTRPDLDAIERGRIPWDGDCINDLTGYARELEAEVARLRANRAGQVERLAAKELPHVQQELKDTQAELEQVRTRGIACTESLHQMRTERDEARTVARRLYRHWPVSSPIPRDLPVWIGETEP